jgi:beta-lactamase regulating signal transducer with metallopeptidase domain
MEPLVHAMLSNTVAAMVLAVFVVILGRAWRRPAVIHSLWLVVMLKLITPPVVPLSLPAGMKVLPSGWPIGTPLAHADSRESAKEHETGQGLEKYVTAEQCNFDQPCDDYQSIPDTGLASGDRNLGIGSQADSPALSIFTRISLPEGWAWEHLVLAVVLTGAVSWWGLAFARIIRFQRLMSDIDPAPDDWQARTNELSNQLGLSEPPSLWLVPGRVPPMLWAIGSRPRLLVPSELWAATSLEQRTSLLLHELAHLKRRDHWVRWLELFVSGIYWWHPAVWFGRRYLREAEEQCCDAWVIWAMPQGAKTYATALLSAIDFVSGARTAPAASSATSGNGHITCLKRRLRMIVRAKTPKGLSWSGRLAVLGTAALLLPLAPSWGQKSDADETRTGVIEPVEPSITTEFVLHALGQTGDQPNPRADQKDERDREDKGRETAERFAEHVKDLVEKLTKELGPVGDELRKILEKSIDEIHETLKKEGATPDDLRKALEKSHDEMRKGLEKGGTVNKELREAFEKSRRDLQEEWERTRGDLRTAMRDRAQPGRLRERRDDVQKDADQPKDSIAKESAEIERERAELEKVRSEVRTLEQQLRQATRRLGELQRRSVQRRGPGGRRGDVPSARVAPGRDPGEQPSERDANPRAVRSPKVPATPATPRRVTPVNPPRRGQVEREVERELGVQPEYDRRLRNLDDKLEEL